MPFKNRFQPLHFKNKESVEELLARMPKIEPKHLLLSEDGYTYLASEVDRLSDEEKIQLGNLKFNYDLADILEKIRRDSFSFLIPVCPVTQKPILIPVEVKTNNHADVLIEFAALAGANGIKIPQLNKVFQFNDTKELQFNYALEELFWLQHLENKKLAQTDNEKNALETQLTNTIANCVRNIAYCNKAIAEDKNFVEQMGFKNRPKDEINASIDNSRNLLNQEENKLANKYRLRKNLFYAGAGIVLGLLAVSFLAASALVMLGTVGLGTYLIVTGAAFIGFSLSTTTFKVGQRIEAQRFSDPKNIAINQQRNNLNKLSKIINENNHESVKHGVKAGLLRYESKLSSLSDKKPERKNILPASENLKNHGIYKTLPVSDDAEIISPNSQPSLRKK